MFRIAVLGASGFAGAELLRLCARHPHFDVVLATGSSMAGRSIECLYPSLALEYPSVDFVPYQPEVLDGCDVVFCALPHGVTQSLIGEIVTSSRVSSQVIVDLSADFRFEDPKRYQEWYGKVHQAPDLLEEFVYGLPELYREHIRGSRLIAAPGCYVTAAALALAPLVAAGDVEPSDIIVDAVSGVSGAGRTCQHHTSFCTVNENLTAYGLTRHRHTPEIEMAIAKKARLDVNDVQVLFTPHLAPINRGILATCYARSASVRSRGRAHTEHLLNVMSDAYASEPFIIVDERMPSTKSTLGSNSVHITVRADERTGRVVAVAALDNLVKGSSGQAIQCANLALGVHETAGLSTAGLYP